MLTGPIELAAAAALLASAEVAALVSDRVYPLMLPQGAMLPALVYQRVESSPHYTMQGYGSESVTLALHSFAGTYEEMKELAEAARGVMVNAPFIAMAQKETDVCGEDVALPYVRTEYLMQQIGGYNHG